MSSVQGYFSRIRPWLQLAKTLLCLPMACSAGFGSILARPVIDGSFFGVVLGVFVLACGAATGNSLQEIEIDRRYLRTAHRPLVTGRVQRSQAWCLCAVLLVSGLLLLLLSSPGYLPLLLGLVAVIAYNGLYTPCKQLSPFALIAGGIAGALPPLIGWTAAGGKLVSSTSWLLFALFFLWQIPHFLLVFMRYRRDYEQTGLPVLVAQLPKGGVGRVLLVWLLALVTVVVASPVLLPQLFWGSKIAFLLLALGVLATVIFLRSLSAGAKEQAAYLWYNSCFFLTMILVMVGQLLC